MILNDPEPVKLISEETKQQIYEFFMKNIKESKNENIVFTSNDFQKEKK